MKNAIISKAKWYIRCCSLVYLSISFSSVVHSAEDVSKMNSVAIAQQAKTRTVVGSVIDFEILLDDQIVAKALVTTKKK